MKPPVSGSMWANLKMPYYLCWTPLKYSTRLRFSILLSFLTRPSELNSVFFGASLMSCLFRILLQEANSTILPEINEIKIDRTMAFNVFSNFGKGCKCVSFNFDAFPDL
jgi:hypothetical protein